MAGKTKSQKKKALDMRSKMYLVLALCSVMLLVSVGISLVLIGGIDLGGADAQSVSTVDSASMVVESGYNKEENTIDTQAYTSTILEQSADAGDSYVDETLFLGDSNTARMYRMFDYCSYDNAIGSVGMTAKSLATFACVQVSTLSGYITMPQAVAKLQPRRVILTFGTNDLNPGYKAADFVKNYQTVIEAITAIRARRNEMSVAPSKKVHYTVATAHADTFSAGIPFFTRLASASDVTIVPADAAIDADGKVEVDTHAARIFMPLAELVDFEKELARIAKEKANAEKQLAGIENKLKNEGFLAKAPEAVVSGARADAEKLKALIEKLDASAAAMKK